VGVNRPGAFAEFLCLPAVNVFPIPDGVSDEVASILDPLGNAVHTALSFDLAGEDVLVTGAGPIGLMAAAVSRHVGARNIVVTDVNPFRLGLGATMGANRAVTAGPGALDAVMAELHMVEGFDVGLEMSGNGAAFTDMLSHMNHGGKIAILGIPPASTAIDWGQVIFKGLMLKGIYGREMFETWYKMVSMLQSGLDVAPVITHRFAAEDFQEAFQVANSGKAGKVLLSW
jgi:threonine 3-dehydrogenase